MQLRICVHRNEQCFDLLTTCEGRASSPLVRPCGHQSKTITAFQMIAEPKQR